MLDLSQHRQERCDYGWMNEEADRIGETKMLEIYNSIFSILGKLEVGQFFDIAKRTQPENHRIVVKACCEYILYHPEYEFNEQYTVITRKHEKVNLDKPRNRMADTKRSTVTDGPTV